MHHAKPLSKVALPNGGYIKTSNQNGQKRNKEKVADCRGAAGKQKRTYLSKCITINNKSTTSIITTNTNRNPLLSRKDLPMHYALSITMIHTKNERRTARSDPV